MQLHESAHLLKQALLSKGKLKAMEISLWISGYDPVSVSVANKRGRVDIPVLPLSLFQLNTHVQAGHILGLPNPC